MDFNTKSFSIDHLKLNKGLYLQAVKKLGNDAELLIYDLRIRKPYADKPFTISQMHSFEHMLAAYLRGINPLLSENVIYVGPMGCMTGFYIITTARIQPLELADWLALSLKEIINADEIAACSRQSCGDCTTLDLNQAKVIAAECLEFVAKIKSVDELNYTD